MVGISILRLSLVVIVIAAEIFLHDAAMIVLIGLVAIVGRVLVLLQQEVAEHRARCDGVDATISAITHRIAPPAELPQQSQDRQGDAAQ